MQAYLTRFLRFWSRTLAAALVVVYLGWNVFWLAQARLPPSLCLALTGLPSPTTGGTRSLKKLLEGKWTESLRYNAMTVPICALTATSLALLGWQILRHERLRLPSWIAWSWGVVLAIAWILKLTGDPDYW